MSTKEGDHDGVPAFPVVKNVIQELRLTYASGEPDNELVHVLEIDETRTEGQVRRCQLGHFKKLGGMRIA